VDTPYEIVAGQPGKILIPVLLIWRAVVVEPYSNLDVPALHVVYATSGLGVFLLGIESFIDQIQDSTEARLINSFSFPTSDMVGQALVVQTTNQSGPLEEGDPDNKFELLVGYMVETIRGQLDKSDVAKIREEIDANPLTWWAPYHFSFGMAVRNRLRLAGLGETHLPEIGTLDDYWVEIVEAAVRDEDAVAH
jgi:hypothetical protein